MPEVMLRPGWPGKRFQRTMVVSGAKKGDKPKSTRTVVFEAGAPVGVSDAEMKALAIDLGVALFEVERDEKNRPRYVESTGAPPPTPEPDAKE